MCRILCIIQELWTAHLNLIILLVLRHLRLISEHQLNPLTQWINAVGLGLLSKSTVCEASNYNSWIYTVYSTEVEHYFWIINFFKAF